MKSAVRFIMISAIVAVLSLSGGCASHRHNKKGRGNRDMVGETVVRVKDKKNKGLNDLRKRIVAEALSWKGTPYRYAGSDKGVGTDCSGMVLRVYEDVAGKKVPRNSRKQAEFSERIRESEVKAGDLVFFATGRDGKTISHVGIMIDGSRFVHASGSKGVIVSEMATPYYRRAFVMYGRVID